MHEYIVNLHMHTPYSDGFGTHREIALSAIKAVIDIVIITDHNVWVNGFDGYVEENGQRVLVLVGEEVHDQIRDPQKNHLLVFNANKELAPYAREPQTLIDKVNEAEGLAFIAHPVDPAAPAVGQDDLSWVNWEVTGYTGIELWNAFSEFKTLLKTKLHAIYYAYNFPRIAHGPLPEALMLWDNLLTEGKKVVAIAGSDAHALRASLGPLKRILFPYEDHFRAVNTHILLPEPLSGDLSIDKRLIYDAFRMGHVFIGYDLPHSTRNFRFTAHGKDKTVTMGDEITTRHGVTMQIRLPLRSECRLIKDGEIIKTWNDRETLTYITSEPGVYRVEVYIPFLGKNRAWIISNPIYLVD